MKTKGELPGNFTPEDLNNLVRARAGELPHEDKMAAYRRLPGGEIGDRLLKLADRRATEPTSHSDRMEAYRKGLL